MSTKTFLSYAKQHIQSSDIQAITDALQQGHITRGENVQAFEKRIAEFCGAKYCVVFNSGTSALKAAYFAAEASCYDCVVTSPNTFIGTLSGAFERGCQLAFTDIDLKTGNMDLESLRSQLHSPRSRGRHIIVPIHFAGIALDIDQLDSCIYDPRVIIIEDGAAALGSTYSNGDRVGSCQISDMTVFSFHPAKMITTGEGGCVTTNRKQWYERLQQFRNNGIVRQEEPPYPGHYQAREWSGNYNFTDFQAALGLSQMERIDAFIQRRKELVACYREHLSSLKQTWCVPKNYDHNSAYQLMFVRINFNYYKTEKKKVMEALAKKNIGTQVHYIPLYLHPVVQQYRPSIKEEIYPHMDQFYEEELTLPLFHDLQEKQIEQICQQLIKILTSPSSKKQRRSSKKGR